MGNGARKTKAIRDNFGGAILGEMAFWELMEQKIGGTTLNEQLQVDGAQDEHLANEEAKLRAELAKLEKKTVDVKRKLERLTEDKSGSKKQKTEADSFSGLSNNLVGKSKD